MRDAHSSPDPKDRGPKPPFREKEQEKPGLEADMKVKPDFGEATYRGLGRLEGRVALITGADSGIGRAVALAYAREGADVVVAYLNEHEDAKETERVVVESGRKAVLAPGDLADEGACRALVDRAVDAFGRVDILVNNAAFQDKAVERFEDLTAERVERSFRTNIMAMFHLVRHALPHMKPGACVINVASIQAYQPSAEILDYAATKGAIVTFTKGLAESLIERGIRANCVAPGPVWTPLITQSFEGAKLKAFGAQSPMKRPAQPAELAPAFVFLASDEASYVNGEVLGVTGGKPLG
jgi:NAD(P)-dependent dehydrogenase (short-subunit alcohol dehydrogenase family)